MNSDEFIFALFEFGAFLTDRKNAVFYMADNGVLLEPCGESIRYGSIFFGAVAIIACKYYFVFACPRFFKFLT